jgi:LmbE family N-acetylglucosaminyl deacetylase
MKALLFAPHNDDESLFAHYQLQAYRPTVIVVLRSYTQLVEQNGPSWEVREAETARAMALTDTDYVQWEWSDRDPDWDSISDTIVTTLEMDAPEVVIAPAWEMGGHEDHNAVASIVAGALSDDVKLVQYLTYQRGYGRTQGVRVEHTLEEETLKAEALDCYASQIRHGWTNVWFPGNEYGTLDEWVLR